MQTAPRIREGAQGRTKVCGEPERADMREKAHLAERLLELLAALAHLHALRRARVELELDLGDYMNNGRLNGLRKQRANQARMTQRWKQGREQGRKERASNAFSQRTMHFR